MGEISSSDCDILVSHLVEDKSSGCGDETGYHNICTTDSGQKTNKFLVCDCNRKHYPGNDDGKDFSRTEL
jgi:hypothetical protein